MIGIDLQNRKPLYEQVQESFQTMIASGILEAGSQMPSVRSLAMELAINARIIQKAYASLEQEGFIYPVRGKGNFVSESKELKGKRQETVYRSLKELVKRGRELDILCEDFISKVRQYYEEGEGEK
ncbi:MAG TPA: GntR family transcriptional regulator [Candidatus Choladousia intestinigallinarum]|nr:GntR family transcriptional regulator [Candidatus Choladousia intestinigallinarum]